MNRYAHILYDDNSYCSPKRATFDFRTKTGLMTTWSKEQAQELLEKKYWTCLSAYSLECSIRRKITFERKHSDVNLLYFKYSTELPESVESYFDFETIETISKFFSLRQITEDVYTMLKEYERGIMTFEEHFFSNWLIKIFEESEVEGDRKSLEVFLMRYVEIFVTKILWNTYGGDLNRLRKDLSAIVYTYTEMKDFFEGV
ncbi:MULTISPECIES: hypothetical protein [Kosmotoga]|uniref:Uncharacterized protein n=1 Tax=Kosmotoga olearia (strain ATCC BAA-1733 / DSM 21960 / TBF 19.5.1) TaxID=521045 RepID=C5CGS9_KOSOT|nr:MULTISPECIES: hypothetical protein [Kosmotoga]ACR80598.1 hypothetical protein Kole_1917 [Kosmotoga olearia TBF 19.5.1]MDI3523271.1 hypothetical protein [Kosmotoga sp.]MDK2952799.1 hypothetical protein [Kosmotoga sp.]OAA19464.1 hypothetical protein DU53_10465 [Kosmotoga sp. DU53]